MIRVLGLCFFSYEEHEQRKQIKTWATDPLSEHLTNFVFNMYSLILIGFAFGPKVGMG